LKETIAYGGGLPPVKEMLQSVFKQWSFASFRTGLWYSCGSSIRAFSSAPSEQLSIGAAGIEQLSNGAAGIDNWLSASSDDLPLALASAFIQQYTKINLGFALEVHLHMDPNMSMEGFPSVDLWHPRK